MARSLWKGRPLVDEIYQLSYARLASVRQTPTLVRLASARLQPFGRWDRFSSKPIVRLYRRNTVITPDLAQAVIRARVPIEVYNGYDFFPRFLSQNHHKLIRPNLAGLVSCIALNVKHKAKLSKHAKKMQQNRLKKSAPGKSSPNKGSGKGSSKGIKKKLSTKAKSKKTKTH